MNLALFGGTFDPVHLGHIAVARAAAKRYALQRIYFVPAYIPPHKQTAPVTAFGHRFAMLAVATEGESAFVPSLLESPEHRPQHGANYTIDTVRNFKNSLGKSDRAFFLIGIDAFLEIASWREPEVLLREIEFIVASRPGFSLADIGKALPESLRPSPAVIDAMQKQPLAGDIVLHGVTIHLLEGMAEKVSATQIRGVAQKGRALEKLVGPAVAGYIRKVEIYRRGPARSQPNSKAAKVHFEVLAGGKSRHAR